MDVYIWGLYKRGCTRGGCTKGELYKLGCSVFTVYFSVYSEHCTVYSVQCTLYGLSRNLRKKHEKLECTVCSAVHFALHFEVTVWCSFL